MARSPKAQHRAMRHLIVTDQKQEWFDLQDAAVLTARRYLAEAESGLDGSARVLNLCRTGRYQGRPMPKHIAIPELSDAHFVRWLALFRDTVEELCPPEVAALFVERAERIGYNFRLRIAQFRGEDLEQVRPIRAGHGVGE